MRVLVVGLTWLNKLKGKNFYISLSNLFDTIVVRMSQLKKGRRARKESRAKEEAC
jgi:hypothetical protein